MPKVKMIAKKCIPPVLLDKLLSVKLMRDFAPYRKLILQNRSMENIHSGKRCFLLGSGNSISMEDLRPLKSEIVFALNNFYVHPDFSEIMSGTVPKYYMTAPIHPPQTEDEWKAWLTEMHEKVPSSAVMFFGLSSFPKNIKYITEKYSLFKEHSIYWYFAGMEFDESLFKPEAMKLDGPVYACEAVSLYALMAAIYMGFSEIYLLGMDHDYFMYENESQMRMYSQGLHQKNELHRTFGNMFYVKEFLRTYKVFLKYSMFSESTSIRIYNASRGGILKVFPRVRLEEVLNETAS